jgi:hypothetical protein
MLELKYINNNNILNKIYLKIFIVFLILVAGMRVSVGNDWDSYLEFYNNLNLANQLIEPGYILINNTLSENEIPFVFFLLLVNSFSLFFAYKFIKENCKIQFLALLIYISDSYFHFNLSGVRQAIALGICCYSVKYALNRSPKIYFLLICLASTFHITALIALINYFIPKNLVFISLKNLVLMIKSILLISLVFIISYDYVYNFFSTFTTIEFRNKLSLKINVYFSSIHGIDASFIIGIVRRLIPLLIVYLYWPAFKRIANFNYFINVYLLGFLIYSTTYIISPDIATRFSIYFLIFECLIISNIAYSCFNNISKFYLIAIYFLIVGYKFTDIIQRPSYDYKFIW